MDGTTLTNIPAMLRWDKQYHVMLAPEELPEAGEMVEGTRQPIEVGEQNETEVEILSGVSAGDVVLVPQLAAGPGPFPGR